MNAIPPASVSSSMRASASPSPQPSSAPTSPEPLMDTSCLPRGVTLYAEHPMPIPPPTQPARTFERSYNYVLGSSSSVWAGIDGHVYVSSTMCIGHLERIP